MAQNYTFMTSDPALDSPKDDHPRIQGALESAFSNNLGPSAPTTTYPGMMWLDTTNMKVMQRTSIDDGWYEVGVLDMPNWGIGGGGGGGGMPTIATYTSPGATPWNKPVGFQMMLVELLGAGGGGGGRTADSQPNVTGGSGGAAGVYGYRLVFDADVNPSETITVGAGGTGNSGAAGNSGGNSSFSMTLAGITPTALGGAPGELLAAGSGFRRSTYPLGGAISVPDFDYFAVGGLGEPALRVNNAGTSTVYGGRGGNSILGAGGDAGDITTQPSQSFTPGGGGGGCSNAGGIAAAAGGTGGNGWVRTWTWTS